MHFFKNILFSGVFSEQPEHQRKITILINIISAFLLLSYLFSVFYYNLSLSGNLPLLAYTVMNSVLLAFVIVFNRKRRHNQAKHLFVIFLIEGTVLTNVYFGIAALFNFVSVIIPLIIFNKRKTVIFYYILFVLLFFITIWLQSATGPLHSLTTDGFSFATYIYVFITFYFTVYAFVYSYKHLNYRYEEILTKEKDRLKDEYDQKTRQLTEKTVRMAHTFEFLEQINKKIDAVLSGEDTVNRGLEEIKRNIGIFEKESIWNEFELHFNDVHPEFYKRLKQECPELTQAELKICALLRLNLNTKEIADITQKTVKSIEVVRTRVRKKFNLDRDEGLFDKLSSFV